MLWSVISIVIVNLDFRKLPEEAYHEDDLPLDNEEQIILIDVSDTTPMVSFLKIAGRPVVSPAPSCTT